MQYCILMTEVGFSNQPWIDYGQRIKVPITDAELEEENKFIRKTFAWANSGVATLNYLVGKGWELVSVQAVPHEFSTGGSIGTTMHYLLRRPRRR